MHVKRKPCLSMPSVHDLGHRSRQAVGEEEEDGESQVVLSFQSAFNEALLSASVSVIAAQSGKSLSYGEVW